MVALLPRVLFPHRLPDPPDNHCHQHPRHQCPKDQQNQQHDQGRDGSALGERLRFIGHITPAGNQGHWLDGGKKLRKAPEDSGHKQTKGC